MSMRSGMTKIVRRGSLWPSKVLAGHLLDMRCKDEASKTGEGQMFQSCDGGWGRGGSRPAMDYDAKCICARNKAVEWLRVAARDQGCGRTFDTEVAVHQWSGVFMREKGWLRRETCEKSIK